MDQLNLISDESESLTAVKEEIRTDVYTTEEEAEERAEEIGCVGTHSHDDNGNMVFMPCRTHAEYIERVGRDISYRKPDDDEEEMSEKQFLDFRTKLEFKSYHDEEKGYFEGYASVFGNRDLGNDVIAKGAFTKSLRNKPVKKIKLLYQHKTDMPIGIFESMKEDDHGLFVKGRIALNSSLGRDAYELMKMGALDGMSIGFRANPKAVHYDKRTKKRTIGEVDLMEISLVTFPMNPKAMVTQVKAEEISIREWENGLRDAFHLSRSEAKVAAKAVHQSFLDTKSSAMLEKVDTDDDLVESIKHLTTIFQSK